MGEGLGLCRTLGCSLRLSLCGREGETTARRPRLQDEEHEGQDAAAAGAGQEEERGAAAAGQEQEYDAVAAEQEEEQARPRRSRAQSRRGMGYRAPCMWRW